MNDALRDTHLFQALQRRTPKCAASAALFGTLQPIASDIAPFLEYIKKSFPSYTGHGIDHSVRIVHRIGGILSPRAVQNLTSCELFVLIIAALFHDIGMVAPDSAEDNDPAIRDTHHLRSRDFVIQYLETRLPLLYNRRLAEIAGFVIESHGLDWATMANREEFSRREKLHEQVIRTPILAVLLRIGDLLDLDSDRTRLLCLQKCRNWIATPASLDHHERHYCVRHFFYDDKAIELSVECRSRQQHQIWDQWVSYLRQDIELANTYVCRDDLALFRLPVPKLTVNRAPEASYNLWPLRFEVDNDGALWEVLRLSVYTGRLDFVRELIQNAIDATLRRLYDRNDTLLEEHSPRAWKNEIYRPLVLVIYFDRDQKLAVFDNGIGMTKEGLENFLFRVAKSGVKISRGDRNFPFPSIATFGIGFTSVLTRAKQVAIVTRKAESTEMDAEALEVHISYGQREAYLERRARSPEGTCIQLDLKIALGSHELRRYIQSTFSFTCSPICFVDWDAVMHLSDEVEDLRKLQALNVRTLDPLRLRSNVLEVKDPQRAVGAIRKFSDSAYRQATKLSKRIDNVGKAAKSILATWNPIADVGGMPPPAPPISKPLFISLDLQLFVRKVCRPQNFVARDARVGILAVPVHFVDLASGIEWSSTHMLLVENGTVQRAISVINRRRGSFIVAADDLSIDSPPWDPDFDELDESLWTSEAEAEPTIECDVLLTKPDEIVLSRYNSLNEAEFQSLEEQEPDNLAQFELLAGKGRYARGHSVEDDEMLGNLTEWFRADYNSVYQDGILLPLSLRELICVGTTAGVANLTAGARFRLNIARNAIDRDPSLLTAWQKNTGHSIVERVACEMRRSLDIYGLTFRWEKLPIEVESSLHLDLNRWWFDG